MNGKTKVSTVVCEDGERGQVAPLAEADAARARMALAGLSLYPTADLGQDPGYTVAEANWRAELHQMVDQLDRTDLAAVVGLVRLLVQVQRDPDLFKFVEQRAARVLHLAGLSPLVSAQEVAHA